MEGIEEEIKKIQYELEMIENNQELDAELPKIEEIKEKPKPKSAGGRKGQSRERMMELHKIRSEKAKEKRELKEKQKEVEQIKKDKINFEYEQAKELKEALEKKKASKITVPNVNVSANPEQEIKEKKELYKSASRDILKEKYLEEAKRRVMADLFS